MSIVFTHLAPQVGEAKICGVSTNYMINIGFVVGKAKGVNNIDNPFS